MLPSSFVKGDRVLAGRATGKVVTMTATAGEPIRPGPPASSRRRRLLLAGLVLVAAAAAGLGWYGWRRHTAPVPPEVPLADADPAVAEAVTAARREVEQAPHAVEPWGRLGKLLRGCDYRTEAAACFAQAARLEPGNPRWPYLQGEAILPAHPDDALPPLRRAAELSSSAGEDAFAPRLRLAEALLATGQLDPAEAELRRALQAEPDHPCVLLDLGLVAWARGDMQASRDHLLRSQHSLFTRKRACIQLAALEQRLGDGAAAAKFSRRATPLPEDVHWSDPWVLECLQLVPGKAGRFRYVEQLEAHDRLEDAVAVLRQVLAEGPDYRASVGLGKDLAQLGDTAGAEQALRAALALSPDSVPARYYLARVLWAQAERLRGTDRERARGLFRAAADWAGQAVKRKPDHARAQMLLGLCLRELGRRKEAVAALRQAVACAPELPDAALHLGEMLAEDGQTAEARTHLENVLRARPEDARARAALARLSADGKAD
jgi:tetratricopeptide (TPR) repeat protein